MAKLSDHQVSPLVRTLLIGDSGSGKTGALVSLVEAGYRLWIADFDNGMDILRNLLEAKNKALLSRVDYETFRDKRQIQGPKLVPLSANAWSQGIKYLETTCKQQPLNGDDIIVVDSLSFAAKSAMFHILKMNNRLTMAPHQSDYGEAQNLTENLAALLTDPSLPCNVICTAHISFQGNEEAGEPIKGFPALIGKALGPVLPRYFNHTLLCRQIGSGSATSRRIHTVTFGNIELKNTNPGKIKDNYKLETGLAEYFRDARGIAPTKAA